MQVGEKDQKEKKLVTEIKKILFKIFKVINSIFVVRGLRRFKHLRNLRNVIFRIVRPNSHVIVIENVKLSVSTEGLPEAYKETFNAYEMQDTWEKHSTELIKKNVKEGQTVIDIGANIGYFSLIMARIVGNTGKVYSFEPEPTNYSILLKNIKLNDFQNISSYQKAVSDSAGQTILHLDDSDTGAHTIRPRTESKEVCTVETIILDDFLKDKGPVDFVKIDCEGADIRILRGMKNTMKGNSDLKILVEYLPGAIEEMGDSSREFIETLLNDYKFNLLAVDDYTRDTPYMKIDNYEQITKYVEGKLSVNLFLSR